ncbi:hypothetical protein [Xylanimonas allomyrinae]|nr:hypothetical protein [Xylanimonas allomyrinae]
MSLSRPVASLFSSVPSLSLLLTTHMLVLIAVRRGEEAARENGVEASTVTAWPRVTANDDDVPKIAVGGASVRALSGIAMRDADEPGAVEPQYDDVDSRPDVAAATRRPVTDLAAWVASRVPAGLPVRGTDVVDAGLANSAATARRKLATLRQTHPALFGGQA